MMIICLRPILRCLPLNFIESFTSISNLFLQKGLSLDLGVPEMTVLLTKLEVQGWSSIFLQGDSLKKVVTQFHINGKSDELSSHLLSVVLLFTWFLPMLLVFFEFLQKVGVIMWNLSGLLCLHIHPPSVSLKKFPPSLIWLITVVLIRMWCLHCTSFTLTWSTRSFFHVKDICMMTKI